MIKTAVIGGGQVGLAVSVGLAQLGWQVACYEQDDTKRTLIAAGKLPFLDAGLAAVLAQVVASGQLRVCADMKSAVTDAYAVFVAVPVTDGPGGMAFLNKAIKDLVRVAPEQCLTVIKSTVPPGTCEALRHRFNIRVAMNPEFMRQGHGFADFMSPSRIVVGADDDEAAKALLRKLYTPLIKQGYSYIETDTRSAEIAKLAANAFLSARITLINEISDFCKAAGGNFDAVQDIIAADKRIGGVYLTPGIGFGGACLPKDGRLLLNAATRHQVSLPFTRVIFSSNVQRPARIASRLLAALPPSPVIAVWGVAFKPGADGASESAAAAMVKHLSKNNARIHAYDPALAPAARATIAAEHWFNKPLDALHNADGLAILLPCESYKNIAVTDILAAMKGRVVLDCVRAFPPADIKQAGLTLVSLNRRKAAAA